ncbi:MAG: hypothetical protein QNJ68_03540 [Microcoleaceae cyanobacterium MO_207.B10]|nr:hypothetical protein [Microcoleaceae cyanobacterium MO_207.B10]
MREGIKQQVCGHIKPLRLNKNTMTGDIQTLIDWQAISDYHQPINSANYVFKGQLEYLQCDYYISSLNRVNSENSMITTGYNKAILKTLAALGMALSEIVNMTYITAKRTREIMRFLTIPVKEISLSVPISFNVFAFVKGGRKNKGFGKSKEQKLEVDTKSEIEDLLPKFLQPSEQTVVVEMWDDNRENLREVINGDLTQSNRGVIKK